MNAEKMVSAFFIHEGGKLERGDAPDFMPDTIIMTRDLLAASPMSIRREKHQYHRHVIATTAERRWPVYVHESIDIDRLRGARIGGTTLDGKTDEEITRMLYEASGLVIT